MATWDENYHLLVSYCSFSLFTLNWWWVWNIISSNYKLHVYWLQIKPLKLFRRLWCKHNLYLYFNNNLLRKKTFQNSVIGDEVMQSFIQTRGHTAVDRAKFCWNKNTCEMHNTHLVCSKDVKTVNRGYHTWRKLFYGLLIDACLLGSSAV